jgi:hypothetical protein
MAKYYTKLNKIKNKTRSKKHKKNSYKTKPYSKKYVKRENKHENKHQKYDNYKIFNLEDINKTELQNNLNIIVSKNVKVPNIGYLSIETLKKILKSKYAFFIYKSNIFVGLVFFYNMTYEFKKTILGSKYILDKDLKSNADINNYILNWFFINYDMDKVLFKNIIDKFRKLNNLYNKNIILTVFKYLHFNNYNQDILFKYIPIVTYKNSSEYKNLTNLGLDYNGYHLTMYNEILNLYSVRYIKKLSSNDFFRTYIITRQFKTKSLLDLTSIKKLLNYDGIININNINKYSIDNTILIYTNTADNGTVSIYNSLPYNFNFVTHFITNNLGNEHIIKNYRFFYFVAKDILGSDIKYFNKIIDSYDKALQIFDNGNAYLLLTGVDVIPFSNEGYFAIGFNNKTKFEEYLNNNNNKSLYGFMCNDNSYINDLFPLKTDTTYMISSYILFTYINNKLKCYVWKDIAFFIYQEKEKDLYNNSEFGLLNILVKPQIFNNTFNTYASKPININKMSIKIRKICSFIGKVYKHHVSSSINQIHGFISIQLLFHFINKEGDVEPHVIGIRPTPRISVTKNLEMSKWIYDLSITPALYPDFKCDNQELHYQPLNID